MLFTAPRFLHAPPPASGRQDSILSAHRRENKASIPDQKAKRPEAAESAPNDVNLHRRHDREAQSVKTPRSAQDWRPRESRGCLQQRRGTLAARPTWTRKPADRIQMPTAQDQMAGDAAREMLGRLHRLDQARPTGEHIRTRDGQDNRRRPVALSDQRLLRAGGEGQRQIRDNRCGAELFRFTPHCSLSLALGCLGSLTQYPAMRMLASAAQTSAGIIRGESCTPSAFPELRAKQKAFSTNSSTLRRECRARVQSPEHPGGHGLVRVMRPGSQALQSRTAIS